MEPSHDVFERSHILYDSHGDVILPPSSVVANQMAPESSNMSVLSAFSLPDRADSLMLSTYPTSHSVYTLHSVLMADGIRNAVTWTDKDLELPARYQRGSVKSQCHMVWCSLSGRRGDVC